RERGADRPRSRDGVLRRRGARRAHPSGAVPVEVARAQRSTALYLRALQPDDLPRERPRHSRRPGHRHRVQGRGSLRPPVGRRVGGVVRAGHATPRAQAAVRFLRVKEDVVGRVVESVRSWAALGAFMGLVTTAAPARAHHSLAMYDGTKGRVFTGVVTRISPGGSHVQILFAPLDEERQAVIRDEKGEPVIWTLELTGAAQAAREGITVKSFAEGTIFSAALHPLRSGDPGGSR